MNAKWISNYDDHYTLFTPLHWKLNVYKRNPEDSHYVLDCPVLFTKKQILSTSDADKAKTMAIAACKSRLEHIANSLDSLEPV